MIQLISIPNNPSNTYNPSIKIIPEVIDAAVTKGVFDEDFYMMDSVAIRNNLTEEETVNLIDSIRDKLPMNQ